MTSTSCHVEDHEHVLAQVLVGDIDRSAEAVRMLVASCAECRSRLAELITLAELMELEGQEGEDLLAKLDYERQAPGSDLVAPFFEQRVSELPDARQKPAAWMRFTAAAAAVLVVSGLGLWLTGQRPGAEASPQARILLGNSDQHFTGAIGEVDEYGPIAWGEGMPSSVDRYEVTIQDAQSLIVVTSFEVEDPTWTPTEAQQLSLPDEITISVAPLGISGQAVGSTLSGRIWRSR